MSGKLYLQTKLNFPLAHEKEKNGSFLLLSLFNPLPHLPT